MVKAGLTKNKKKNKFCVCVWTPPSSFYFFCVCVWTPPSTKKSLYKKDCVGFTSTSETFLQRFRRARSPTRSIIGGSLRNQNIRRTRRQASPKLLTSLLVPTPKTTTPPLLTRLLLPTPKMTSHPHLPHRVKCHPPSPVLTT